MVRVRTRGTPLRFTVFHLYEPWQHTARKTNKDRYNNPLWRVLQDGLRAGR